MQQVKFFSGEQIPLELHKVRVVQKLNLVPIERRYDAINEAAFNDYQLSTKDIYLDMLTDSGCNAMSDNQVAAMMRADDAYAGSQSFERFHQGVIDVLGKKLLLPCHQGRAAEHILAKAFIKPGNVIPCNYHFTTFLAHVLEQGATVRELLCDGATDIVSDNPFKGNMDIDKLTACIEEVGPQNIPFIRMEASTNLIGGQPFSMKNLMEVRQVADHFGILIVMDASLLGENAYLIKVREKQWQQNSMAEILKMMTGLADVVYFSARKLTSSRGGGICTNRQDLFDIMAPLIPEYEGFLTYGGMSVREIEAMAVGIYETTDETMISQSVEFIKYLVDNAVKLGVPMVQPAGVLGAHIDAGGFCEHLKQTEYPAAALSCALYLCGGIRGMERGTMSSVRDENGVEKMADMELLRLAVPRRVFTLSQIKYVIDRLHWLHENRELIGGLRWTYEPKVLRFFLGRMEPTSDWPAKIVTKFRKDFGDSL